MINIIFFVLFFSTMVFAAASEVGHVAVDDIDEIGHVVIEDVDTFGHATFDSCSGLFVWHMENIDIRLGTPGGCSEGADKIGTAIASPVFDPVLNSDGTYGLLIDTVDQHVKFDVSANDCANPDDIKVTFDIYIVSFPTTGSADFEFFRLEYVDSDNAISGRIVEGGTIRFYRTAQTTPQYVEVSAASETPLSCEYQAKTGVGGADHYLDCGGTPDEDNDGLLTFAASADTLYFGDDSGDEAGEYNIDNVSINVSNRF